MLRHLQIVDTPGTNALDREHEAITRDYVPRSDLVLWRDDATGLAAAGATSLRVAVLTDLPRNGCCRATRR